MFSVSNFHSDGNMLLFSKYERALISEKRIKNFTLFFIVSDILVVMKNRRYAWYFFLV